MLQFAFSSNGFRKYSLVDTIAILADLGYEGIEIMADLPHAYPPDLTDRDIRAIRKALERHCLQVSNINAFMLHAVGDTWHPSWIEKDPALRAKRVDHTLRCIDLAKKLGARTISTEPGGPLDGMDFEEGSRLFLQGLQAVEDKARKAGVMVLIEPEPELLIENSRQFRTFFQKLDPEVFGLNFDVGHFYCVGEDPIDLIWEFKDITHHFHLEDIAPSRVHHHLMLGEGAIDLAAVLKTIYASGYGGLVTVELYPYENRPVNAARSALLYLQEWSHSHKNVA
jgi:sugar phosphate isomerase/epimerase